MLEQIILSIEKEEILSLDKIKEWIKSKDIQVMAGAFYFLTNYHSKIEPEPELNDYYYFFLDYLKRCIKENFDINAYRFIDSRYTAARYLTDWFKYLWKDKKIPLKKKEKIKYLIKELYLDGDEEIKNCVITGILEHLFLDKSIQKFFHDWSYDQILKTAYKEAILYSKEIKE